MVFLLYHAGTSLTLKREMCLHATLKKIEMQAGTKLKEQQVYSTKCLRSLELLCIRFLTSEVF